MMKKIHYVWLGGGSLSKNIQYCIDSWKKMMPDWEIIRWDESNFDTQKYTFIREALDKKKYAFAADIMAQGGLSVADGCRCLTKELDMIAC